MCGQKGRLAASVGAKIAEKRKRLGMSQGRLSELLGINQVSLSRMENGEISPKFSRLQDIADALSCSVAELFHFESSDSAKKGEKIAEMINTLPERAQGLVAALVVTAVTELRDMGEE
jgi:transcriptional regulator with XRE-family HTH domain